MRKVQIAEEGHELLNVAFGMANKPTLLGTTLDDALLRSFESHIAAGLSRCFECGYVQEKLTVKAAISPSEIGKIVISVLDSDGVEVDVGFTRSSFSVKLRGDLTPENLTNGEIGEAVLKRLTERFKLPFLQLAIVDDVGVGRDTRTLIFVFQEEDTLSKKERVAFLERKEASSPNVPKLTIFCAWEIGKAPPLTAIVDWSEREVEKHLNPRVGGQPFALLGYDELAEFGEEDARSLLENQPKRGDS